MTLVLDSDFVYWLTNWERLFEWDAGNLRKNEKHGIAAKEIEQMFDSPVYVAGRIVGSEIELRWLLLGRLVVMGGPLL